MRKNAKKIMALALAAITAVLCMSTSFAASAVQAEEFSTEIYTGQLSGAELEGTKVSVAANAGDTVIVYTKVKNAASVLGIQETICYDDSALKYVGYGSDYSAGYMETIEYSGFVYWNNGLSTTGLDLIEEQTIAAHKFTVLKDITGDELVLAYTVDEFFNSNYEEIDHDSTVSVVAETVSNGGGTDKDTDSDTDVDSDRLIGDINDDGVITIADAVLACRISVSLESCDDKLLPYADVSGDGYVTVADGVEIARYTVSLATESNVGKLIG